MTTEQVKIIMKELPEKLENETDTDFYKRTIKFISLTMANKISPRGMDTIEFDFTNSLIRLVDIKRNRKEFWDFTDINGMVLQSKTNNDPMYETNC